MEPLAAFSLAGTIPAFSRFGIELLGDGRELYISTQGTLTANELLELATADLRDLVIKLQARDSRPDAVGTEEADDVALSTFQRILRDAEATAEELVGRLDDLKVKHPKHRKWESVRKAVQCACTKDEIESLTKKLARFKEAVETNVLISTV